MDPNQPNQIPTPNVQSQVDSLSQTPNNWFKIFLTVLVLIVVGGGGYLLGIKKNQPSSFSQQNPIILPSSGPTNNKSLPTDTPNDTLFLPKTDETASWKTYTSIKRKFTINYPSNWLTSENDSNGLYIISPDKAKDSQSFYMLIGIFETQKQSLNDYVKTTFTEKSLALDSMINGIQFYRLTNPDNKYPHLIAKVDARIIDVQTADGFLDGGVYYYDEKDPVLMTNIKISYQILSTFKFADQNTTTDISGWKTYTSQEYGFVLNYPPSVVQEETLSSTKFNRSHEYFKINGGVLEIYGVCGRGVVPIKQQDITIAGQKTIKFYETDTNGVISAIKRPSSNESLCFNFTLPKDPTLAGQTDQLFDQIFSTLKFTQ